MFKAHTVSRVNKEEFSELQDFLNNTGDNVNHIIYLSSTGGDPTLVKAFSHLLEVFKVKLVACGQISSAALDLFLISNVERQVLEDTYGVYHEGVISNWDTDSKGNLKINKSYRDLLKQPIHHWKMIENFLEITPSELRNYKKGEDLYVNAGRIDKALKNSKKYFAER